MAISIPTEPVYYYECSYGKFRLTYFIPVEVLKKLASQNKIKRSVLKDFPDGVDLDCTRPDFLEFEKTYGYKPSHKPKSLRRTFLAMYSSTKNWKKFVGSGYIQAKALESHVKQVEKTLEEKKVSQSFFPTVNRTASSKDKQKVVAKRLNMNKKIESTLHRMKMEGMDKSHSMKNQKFKKIKMDKGKESTVDFFKRLQSKHKK